MLICGFNKTTLLDYPEHVAASVFLGGCNFRCPFCQNKDLLLNPADFAAYSEQEILDHLKKRSSMLTGVCVSGGEPTIYKELPDFIKKIKELGFLVKLDTNGTNPQMLRHLYEESLIDYVAMDIKAGLSDYFRVAGISETETSIFTASGQNYLENIKDSVHFLMHETDSSRFTYEFRTTVVRELHDASSFQEIGRWIAGAKRYFLQSYRDSENVLCPGYHSYKKEEMEFFAEIVRPFIPNVALRGLD
nr:anaerobic ribonucleoside-triphosphate reductase activating protein [Lachnospiraceae bacterium]